MIQNIKLKDKFPALEGTEQTFPYNMQMEKDLKIAFEDSYMQSAAHNRMKPMSVKNSEYYNTLNRNFQQSTVTMTIDDHSNTLQRFKSKGGDTSEASFEQKD